MERENPKNLAELQSFFSETRETIENQLFPLAQKYGNREAMKALRQAWLRLLQGPVRVLFLGASSAGKSTLINAMIGRVVVPEGRHTTSPVPVWIFSSEVAGKAPDIQMVRETGWDSLPELSDLGEGIFIIQYCYTSREAGSDAAREKYNGLIAARMDVRFQPAPDSFLTMIDAPGIAASEGDNLRVEDALKQGCEMVVIVFQDMTQSNEEYLQQLLVEDSGLLHPLLESGRVFAVHNWINHSGTEADATAHIGKLFGGEFLEKHVYMINAFMNRQMSAGIYDYMHFLQEGITGQEKQEAKEYNKREEEQLEKLKKKEEKKLEKLKKELKDSLTSVQEEELREKIRKEWREDLERLWADLQERGRQLTETPKELTAVIAPIRAGVNRAIGLLEREFNREIKRIRKSGLGTNQEKVEQRYAVQERLVKVIAAEGYLKEAFDDADENSLFSKWIKEIQAVFPRLLSFVKSRPELRGHRLICEQSPEANQILLKGIEESDWASNLVDGLLSYRAAGMNPAFSDALLSPDFREKVRAFTQIFQRKVQEVDQYLAERNFSTPLLQVTQEDIARQIEGLHEQAVRQAALTFSLALDHETKNTLRNYLADKQTRINSGKLRSHLSQAFLSVNLEVDLLDPYVLGKIDLGMSRYAKAMGLYLRAAAKETGEQYQLALKNERLALERQISFLEVQINTEREAIQKAEIDKIEEQRQKIRALRIQHENTAGHHFVTSTDIVNKEELPDEQF